MMGVYLFSGQSLSWLPPLVFTAMNEAGVSIRLSMLSLVSFWIIALFFLQCMGSYETAVGEVIFDASNESECEQIEITTSNEE
jgi:MFS-type transporter involved in bile tolerance (Atg22 family)